MFPFALNTTLQPGCSPVNFDPEESISCDSWKFDRSLIKTTAVEDFEMICGHKQRKSLTQTFYMVGMLIGMINIIQGRAIKTCTKAASCLVGSVTSLEGKPP